MINLDKPIMPDLNKSNKLTGNIVFCIYCFLLSLVFIPRHIELIEWWAIAGMVFVVTTGILLLMKTKVGLICSYIINGLCIIFGLFVLGLILIFMVSALIFEPAAIMDKSALVLIALGAFCLGWNGFYMYYYIKNRKIFTNKNLNKY